MSVVYDGTFPINQQFIDSMVWVGDHLWTVKIINGGNSPDSRFYEYDSDLAQIQSLNPDVGATALTYDGVNFVVINQLLSVYVLTSVNISSGAVIQSSALVDVAQPSGICQVGSDFYIVDSVGDATNVYIYDEFWALSSSFATVTGRGPVDITTDGYTLLIYFTNPNEVIQYTFSGALTGFSFLTPEVTNPHSCQYHNGVCYIGADSIQNKIARYNLLRPTANAGGDSLIGETGLVVLLDGSGSVGNAGLTYLWVLTVPAGSAATLSSTTIYNPFFTPDIDGEYIATLVVRDALDSFPDFLTVNAAAPLDVIGQVLSGRVRRLDPTTGDIVTSGVQFIGGTAAIEQTIRTRLRLFRGEYFRNITLGTPWFQEILTKEGSIATKNAILKRIILRTPGVSSATDFVISYDLNTRTYSIVSTVITESGQLILDQQGTF